MNSILTNKKTLTDTEVKYIRFQARCSQGYDIPDRNGNDLVQCTAYYVAQELFKKLEDYIYHGSECNIKFNGSCSCGLDELKSKHEVKE